MQDWVGEWEERVPGREMTVLALIQTIHFDICQNSKKGVKTWICLLHQFWGYYYISTPSSFYHCQREKIEMTPPLHEWNIFLSLFHLKVNCTSAQTVYCSILCPFFPSFPFWYSLLSGFSSSLASLALPSPWSWNSPTPSPCPPFSPYFHRLTYYRY